MDQLIEIWNIDEMLFQNGLGNDVTLTATSIPKRHIHDRNDMDR